MKREQLDAVLRLAAGEATAAELSVELGVSTNEVESWRARDPIPRHIEHLRSLGRCDDAALNRLEREVAGIVDDAVRFAQAGQPVDPALVFELMFVDQKP